LSWVRLRCTGHGVRALLLDMINTAQTSILKRAEPIPLRFRRIQEAVMDMRRPHPLPPVLNLHGVCGCVGVRVSIAFVRVNVRQREIERVCVCVCV